MRLRSDSTRRALAGLTLGCLLLFPAAARGASDNERGTIGIRFRQLFDERQPNHRGPLVVLRVEDNSPAEKAGIQCSDFVTAVNGTPVAGREFMEIVKTDLQGSIGGTVRLSVLRSDGSQSEISLTRAPFPPHKNPASDSFAYVVPGLWSTDPRYTFPLPWSPALAYQGVEDLFYVPNFAETGSPEYHSYVFFWWLDGAPVFDAARLESDMLTYFRGLAQERGRNFGFTPDLSKVTASYREDPAASRTYGGAPARTFSGTVSIWDTHGKVIRLQSEVAAAQCPGSGHTALFFGMSLEPRDGTVWKEIDAVRDTFRCAG
ncbi:MAG TPA: PDZ domain-containing protein [Thermoanaerobaculia bacterium]|nr:PDZ domain-containing protein [Thermoanaerobaculia bacterium]